MFVFLRFSLYNKEDGWMGRRLTARQIDRQKDRLIDRQIGR